METLTLQEMKANYPDEWILVGNPNLGDPQRQGLIINRLIDGIVLYHSKDKRELAQNAQFVREGYRVTLFFTGEMPKNRKFWL